MHKIEFSKTSANFLKKLDKQTSLRIIEKIETLKNNPIPHNSKFIKRENNEKIFRYRIGNYRALYKIKPSQKTILITKIDKRSKIYQ